MSLKVDIDIRQGDFSLAINTELPASGLTAIFGPSGCGKTTLLKCIAGLCHAEGLIQLNDHIWQDSDNNSYLEAHQRNLAYVFQDARLLPHLTVLENLHLNQRLRGTDQNSALLDQAIEELQLQPLLNQYVSQLSGGQRQRVGLARALISEPDLILMDEPLSALDEAAKAEVMTYLKRFRRTTKTPILYVSHAIEEVSQLAEHLVIMKEGRLIASGQTQPLFSERPDLFQESQLASLLEARVVEVDKAHHLVLAEIESADSKPVRLWLSAGDLQVGQHIRLRIAARDVSLSLVENPKQSILNCLPATISRVIASSTAGTMTISLLIGGQTIHTQITQKSFMNLELGIGTQLWAQVKALSIFD